MLIEKFTRYPAWSVVVERVFPACLFRTATPNLFNQPARPWCCSHMSNNSARTESDVARDKVLSKRELRAQVKSLLRESGLDKGHNREASSQHIARRILHDLGIMEHINGMTMYIACERLMEVDTSTLLEYAFTKNIDVYLPRVLDSDSNMHFLKTHRNDTYNIVPPFGIHEPTEYMQDGVTKREDVCEQRETPLDVMIVPGLAFGEGGERLGRGGGYYDTFIATYIRKKKKKPLLVGVAFDEQIVKDIPMDVHDYHMDIIVTPSKVYHRNKT